MKKNSVNGQQYILVLGALLLCAFFLYVLRSVLLPFAVGIVVAYFLNPSVGRLAKFGMSRAIATSVVMGLFILILIPGIFLFGSMIVSQIADFIGKLPNYADTFVKRIMPLVEELKTRFTGFSSDNLESMLRENAFGSVNLLGKILKSVITNGFAFINLLSLLLISPVVAFYMLRDWPEFTDKMRELVPQKYRGNVLEAVQEVNKIVSGYLRGQFCVCLVLGSYYSLGLWSVNLEMGITVGFLAGMISFIPYVGSISGFIMAMALAITQYGTWDKITAVIVVFAIGQFVEGNFLTPKLVGENIGLHPVWVMFALLAGGVIWGLLGMIIAVPVAAIIGVLLRYLLKNYRESALYLDS